MAGVDEDAVSEGLGLAFETGEEALPHATRAVLAATIAVQRFVQKSQGRVTVTGKAWWPALANGGAAWTIESGRMAYQRCANAFESVRIRCIRIPTRD